MTSTLIFKSNGHQMAHNIKLYDYKYQLCCIFSRYTELICTFLGSCFSAGLNSTAFNFTATTSENCNNVTSVKCIYELFLCKCKCTRKNCFSIQRQNRCYQSISESVYSSLYNTVCNATCYTYRTYINRK